MEDTLVDMDEFRQMLTDHLDPIKETVARLEKQQEKILEIIATQATILSNLNHLEDTVKAKVAESEKVHNTLFERIRELEQGQSDKLWDIVKLILAAAFGGFIAVFAGKR